MNIIKHREHGVHVSYYLNFPGFSFPCDKEGKVDVSALQPAGAANYAKCVQSGKGEVEESHHRYTTPAVGECECGSEVELSGFTNTCQCGADYNMSGQLLAPREQWGEETGESLSDILSIP